MSVFPALAVVSIRNGSLLGARMKLLNHGFPLAVSTLTSRGLTSARSEIVGYSDSRGVR